MKENKREISAFPGGKAKPHLSLTHTHTLDKNLSLLLAVHVQRVEAAL